MAIDTGPNVRYTRSEMASELDKWQLIRDCLEGEKTVKAKGDIYLPRPNPDDKSKENQDRYKAYITRAVFYNATRRTLDGLIGQVYLREPIATLPDGLQYLLEDSSGEGIGLHEQSKKALADTTSYGRLGLLVDYPDVPEGVTKASQESNYIRPSILIYQPETILNWRTAKIGGRRLLSLVVLEESWIVSDDGFQPLYGVQWRVLRLVPIDSVPENIQLSQDTNHIYVVEIWQLYTNPSDPKQQSLGVKERFIPKDATGNPLTEIPFTFIGAINNDPEVDPAPLYDLATLNIAHYRNSADYEEACFLVGQPTVYATGLTEAWVKEFFANNAVCIGSRTVIPGPVGSNFGLLQVNPNTLPKEAMDQKEKQMVALGARLVEQRNVAQTLGEAQQTEAAQTSILASVAKNVGKAYTRCLKWCALFQGTSGDVNYELNTDFIAAQMTPEERAELVAEWIDGAISRTEMRNRLRRAGIATQKDEEAATESNSDKLRLSSLMAKKGIVEGNPNVSSVAPQQNSKTQI